MQSPSIGSSGCAWPPAPLRRLHHAAPRHTGVMLAAWWPTLRPGCDALAECPRSLCGDPRPPPPPTHSPHPSPPNQTARFSIFYKVESHGAHQAVVAGTAVPGGSPAAGNMHPS